jgi:hypothetical protein
LAPRCADRKEKKKEKENLAIYVQL